MSISKPRIYGLKTRLTVMMALLLGATLSLFYLLSMKVERDILGQVEGIVENLEDEVNDYIAKHREHCGATAVAAAPPWRADPWDSMFQGPLSDVLAALKRAGRARDIPLLRLPGRSLKRRSDRTSPLNLIQFEFEYKKVGPVHLRTVKAAKLVPFRPRLIHDKPPPSRGATNPCGPGRPEDASPNIPVALAPVQDLIGDFRLANILIVVPVFILGVVLSWVLATHFTRPLSKMKLAFGRVAAGNLGQADLPRRRDEIGEMGESFRVMVGKLKENRDLEKRMFEQERFSTLGHLAAGVAHDVRNPLNAIGLTIDHMQDEFSPEDPEKKASFLRFSAAIRSEIARLDSLVNNFLSLAKPPSLDVKPNDLNEIVQDLLELIRKEAESRGITLATDLDPRLGAVPVDGERIRAAIMNLVLNALQSMDGKGEVRIRTKKVGREAHLIVEDRGCGIAPKDVERVFLPYYTTREEGTGLGLAVSRVTVEGHGGRIDLRSQVGQGTTVTVVLPIDHPESGA